MKYSRILPAAASIIALTATIGFARDIREVDEADSLRIRVEMCESNNSVDDIAVNNAMPAALQFETACIYRVEIERGNKTKVVSIDAYTGRILGKIDEQDKTS